MAVAVSHATQATLPNDANKEISSDAWNEEHEVTGLGTAAESAVEDFEAAGEVATHAAGAGVHAISGVTGLQDALDAKAPLASPTFTGTVSGVTKAMVGLANVDNTADAGKPVSTAQQTALDLKANLASPTFTGTVAGITKSMVGLANVDNTADSAKPVSTAQQTALDAKQATLVSATNIKTVNGTTLLGSGDLVVSGGAGDLVYAPTPADVAINSLTDVTIVTRDVTGVAAGDQIIVETEFIILNNSAATRNIIVTLDFDGAFDVEMTLPALATSATLMQPVFLRAVCNVRSTSLAYAMYMLDMQLAAGVAAGTDTSAAATHLSAKGWGTSGSNLTGTLTCALFIRSAATNTTQTCRLVGFTIRKVSPT